MIRPPFFRRGSQRAPSMASKDRMKSASPSSTMGEYTFSPYFTYVTTEPPRCDMPCTSLSFTS